MDSFLSNWFHNGKGGKERPKAQTVFGKGNNRETGKEQAVKLLFRPLQHAKVTVGDTRESAGR